MKGKLAIVLCLMLSMRQTVRAQMQVVDSVDGREALSRITQDYYDRIGDNAHLYNGSEAVFYTTYNPVSNKNPYFLSLFISTGSLVFDGFLYRNVPLCYDIFHDELISTRRDGGYRVRLPDDKIDSFILAGHHFVRLSEDSVRKLPFGTGFYELIYQGKVTVLAKRKKKIDEKITNTEAIVTYPPDDHFYIIKNATIYPVSTKKSVLEVLDDHSNSLRKYLRKNHISFKSDLAGALLAAAAFHDQKTP